MTSGTPPSTAPAAGVGGVVLWLAGGVRCADCCTCRAPIYCLVGAMWAVATAVVLPCGRLCARPFRELLCAYILFGAIMFLAICIAEDHHEAWKEDARVWEPYTPQMRLAGLNALRSKFADAL